MLVLGALDIQADNWTSDSKQDAVISYSIK